MYCTGQINFAGKQFEQIIKKHWLFFKIEHECFVVQIMVGNLYDILGEDIMSEGRGGVLHHGEDSLVPLVVENMELD
jgi:hypothetical protein